jgi:PKD repeat protein
LGLEYLYCSLDYNLRYHCGTDASSWVSFRYLVSATPAFAVNEVLTGQSSGVTARFGRYYNNYDGTWYLDVRWTQNAFTPGETVTGNTLNLTIGSFINAAVRSSPYDDWKAFTGNDAHTLYIDPLLNPVTFIPAENSPAIAAGTNLYSAGITNDILGNARPTNGLWTIGPWEGGTNTPTPDVMANFSAIPTLGLAPLTVSFTDSSTGSPIQWEWDFANNGLWTSDVQNPSFTYSNAGIYSVKLTVNGTNSLIRAGHITFTNAPSAPETNGFYIKDAHINQIIFR